MLLQGPLRQDQGRGAPHGSLPSLKGTSFRPSTCFPSSRSPNCWAAGPFSGRLSPKPRHCPSSTRFPFPAAVHCPDSIYHTAPKSSKPPMTCQCHPGGHAPWQRRQLRSRSKQNTNVFRTCRHAHAEPPQLCRLPLPEVTAVSRPCGGECLCTGAAAPHNHLHLFSAPLTPTTKPGLLRERPHCTAPSSPSQTHHKPRRSCSWSISMHPRL